jgi:ferredoxin
MLYFCKIFLIVMAIIITDECINCGACEPECPNTAIYEGADDWRYKDGTKLLGKIVLSDGTEVDADAPQKPVSDDIYYIVPGKCTECKGFHDEPQCAAVCPVDCCVPDDNHVESDETLLNRQAFLHNEK